MISSRTPDLYTVILAAGEGRRLDGPKALTPLGGRSFLTRVIQTILDAGLSQIAIVLAAGADRVVASHDLSSTRIIRNPAPDEGPISSIRAALEDSAVAAAGGILVHAVDHPLVRASTVAALCARPEAIVVPTFGGRGGHPGVRENIDTPGDLERAERALET